MWARIESNAANLGGDGDNPAYISGDFLEEYPQFVGAIPEGVLEMYLKLGHACVREARWCEMWRVGLGLFVAHWCTLWLRSSAEPKGDAASALAGGEVRGLVSSKSVGGASVSYDLTALSQDLEGWAGYKLTAFGVQFATLARMLGRGGMVVR